MKELLVTLCFLSAVWLPARAMAAETVICPDPTDGDYNESRLPNITTQFLIAYLNDNTGQKIDNLDVAHGLYQQMLACKSSDGTPMTRDLLVALSLAPQFSGGNWDLIYQRSQALEKRFPNEALGPLAVAEYWDTYAWDARGRGMSGSVTNEGWKLYNSRLAMAKAKLIDSKSIASSLPTWYHLMVRVQGALDEPIDASIATLREGAAKFPDYLPLYMEMERFLEPKWGGSWAAVDQFAVAAAKNSEATEGKGMYAQIYARVNPCCEQGPLFQVTKAQWPLAKQGFEDLKSRHMTDGFITHRYGSLACQAGDKATFLKVRRELGSKISAYYWTEYGGPSVDFCDLKYGYKE